MKNQEINQLVRNISYSYKNRHELFLELKNDEQSFIILKLTKHVQFQLLKKLSDLQIITILENLDPDKATDLIQRLSKNKQKLIISQLNTELKSSVSILLHFDPETAAGVMSINYIRVHVKDKIVDVSVAVKNHEKRTGKLPTILVVKESKLFGELKGHQLGFSKPNDIVADYMKKVRYIKYDASYQKVVADFRQHPHDKVVVVGDKKQILGVIYTDDILRLIESSEDSTLYDFAGVSNEESVYDSVKRKVNFRYKWLIINLGTSFAAAFVVASFSDIISKNVLLAVYMPIVAGMGGNSGTQTLAIMVRGLSQNKIDKKIFFQTLKNELAAGVANGVINGLIVMVIVYIVNRDLLVGIILALAMVFNLFIAALFGTIVPVIMKKLGKDPASSATVFITTATDIFGFMVFLGLATILL
jgi:magnesium transporter